MSKAGTTAMTKILAYLRTFFAKDDEVIKTVNLEGPDQNGNLDLRVVDGAKQIVTEQAQQDVATFAERTTGGDASVGDGTAVMMSLRGNMVHTGEVTESITMTLTTAERPEGETPITAELDEDAFKAAVSESGTTTLLYTTAWSADPSTYGVTVTGTPAAGDTIKIVYVKGNRGLIKVPTPSAFRSTGYNLYNHTLGYARVLKYSNMYGFLIDGAYTALKFSTTVDGPQTTLTDSSGYFQVPSDGYVWVTGGNNTTTEIYMTWSDWVGGREGSWKAYSESEIDLSDLVGTGKFFPYGLIKVGSVYDEIDFNSALAIKRCDRTTYTDEHLATVIASGLPYECDEDYIYFVKAEVTTDDIELDGSYSANDHGLEIFDDTDAPATIVVLYGENLVDKLRTDVVTKSSDLVNAGNYTGTGKALDARYGKTLKDSVDSLSDQIANLVTSKTFENVSVNNRGVCAITQPSDCLAVTDISADSNWVIWNKSGTAYNCLICDYNTTPATNVVPVISTTVNLTMYYIKKYS